MKIAHRKAQAETYKKPSRQAIFSGPSDGYIPSRPFLGVLGEVGFYVPKKAQPVNPVGELVPPTRRALSVQRIPIDANKAPGEFLAPERENLLLFGDLPLMGAGAFLLHVSLLPGEAQS